MCIYTIQNSKNANTDLESMNTCRYKASLIARKLNKHNFSDI